MCNMTLITTKFYLYFTQWSWTLLNFVNAFAAFLAHTTRRCWDRCGFESTQAGRSASLDGLRALVRPVITYLHNAKHRHLRRQRHCFPVNILRTLYSLPRANIIPPPAQCSCSWNFTAPLSPLIDSIRRRRRLCLEFVHPDSVPSDVLQ